MKLKDLIETSGLKLGYVAKEMGLSYGLLDKKLSGKIEFKTTEIAILKSLLNLSGENTFGSTIERKNNVWKSYDSYVKYHSIIHYIVLL